MSDREDDHLTQHLVYGVTAYPAAGQRWSTSLAPLACDAARPYTILVWGVGAQHPQAVGEGGRDLAEARTLQGSGYYRAAAGARNGVP